MKRVGFVGWRGMVGSVLMQRMREENDFNDIEPVFFTTSQAGQAGPNVGKDVPALKDANDINELASEFLNDVVGEKEFDSEHKQTIEINKEGQVYKVIIPRFIINRKKDKIVIEVPIHTLKKEREKHFSKKDLFSQKNKHNNFASIGKEHIKRCAGR